MTTRRNMALGEKLYHAKVLLFGEYGIIKDAMGLSIPYDFYKGAWSCPKASPMRRPANPMSTSPALPNTWKPSSKTPPSKHTSTPNPSAGMSKQAFISTRAFRWATE